jgi:allantoate deiminase
MSPTSYVGQGERVIDRCREIAAFTEVPGTITRTFLAPSMHGVHARVRGWMESIGMSVRIDAAGNIRGLYPGNEQNGPRLLIGSHLDTVPNAGAFDGILGVILGVAVVEQLQGSKLPFAIEVIGFSDEEGVQFGEPFIGSLALVGKLDERLLSCTDSKGMTIVDAIRSFGLDVKELAAAGIAPEAFAYIEFHIEQGPVLDAESVPLGIVDAIVGQSRYELTFTGRANHAGTTPMNLRQDALAAASEWVVAVEEEARSHAGLVATVGKICAHPGAGNVIPGCVVASLDVRHADDQTRKAVATRLILAAEAAGQRRGVQLASRLLLEQPAVSMDSHLADLLRTASHNVGARSLSMVSGGGHDAMVLAPYLPSSMLFVRSPGGISHHPDESVLPEDVEAALATAMEFLSLLSNEKRA